MALYQHYKGAYYLSLFRATHSETGEELVVYYNVEDKSKVWARPREMFFEDVEVNGKKVPRFKEIVVDNLLIDGEEDDNNER